MQIVNFVNSNKPKAAAQQQQPEAPLPQHMHSGDSLQQNEPSGPQLVNINQTYLQQNRVSRKIISLGMKHQYITKCHASFFVKPSISIFVLLYTRLILMVVAYDHFFFTLTLI